MRPRNGNGSLKFTATLKENKNCYASATQREILMALVNKKVLGDNFFLTGGTALAVFYLHHRRSNDLDFFTLSSTDLSEIDFFLKSNWRNQYSKIKESANFLSALLKNVRVDFMIDPLSFDEEREKYFLDSNLFLLVDTAHNIVTNKFCTIASRIEPKDFIDFYFINRKLNISSLEGLYEDARKKDAIFDDPPTVAYQIEQGLNFIEKNPSLFPELLIDFSSDDFYRFYRESIDWIYRKIKLKMNNRG